MWHSAHSFVQSATFMTIPHPALAASHPALAASHPALAASHPWRRRTPGVP